MLERRHAQRDRRPRVLIVDDHLDTCDLYEAVLESQAFEVVCTTDGLTALAILNNASFEALVVDADMPVIDGWELIARVKGDPRYTALPIVMVTAHAFPSVERRAREAGCAAYFVKPFLPLDLAGALRRLLFAID